MGKLEKLTDILSRAVSEAFAGCGYDYSLGTVVVSDRLDLCQFQCNGSFAAAKLYKKPPLVVAGEVAARLESDARIKSIEAVRPGFINITLTDEYLLEYLSAVNSDPSLGVPQDDSNKSIVMDYGGPNVAKSLHIGHLRSAIIGEAIKRIARAMGITVYSDVHLGNWGTPMGLVIAEYSERHPEWACFREDFDPERDELPVLDPEELNEIYPYASAKSKQDEAFKEKAHRITFELQSRRPGYYALWKQLVSASVSDVKKIFGALNVDFDLWYGESDSDDYIPELVSILDSKGLLHESEGALVVDVKREDDKITVPPVIIKKSDSSSTYATTDLATIIQRERDYHPGKILYVVDKRQSLHFEQVFRCARMAELVPEDTQLSFLGFGTMNGSDGKPFKTRDGGTMKLSELIRTATDEALEKLRDSQYLSSDIEEIARKIGIAAIKFGDLSNQPSKDYIFDLGKFLSFDGKTGTYLLYTVTRINSILSRAGIDSLSDLTPSGIYSDAEREIVLDIILSGEAYQKALSDLAPSVLCDCAYNLASAFSRFYHDNRILSEEDGEKRTSWLALCLITRRVLVKLLETLGIEPVEHM